MKTCDKCKVSWDAQVEQCPECGVSPVAAALQRLVNALGELPAGTLDQASEAAYRSAANLLDPDEFTERFMAQAKKT